MADQPLVARVLVHAEKHHRGALDRDPAGEGVDGVVVPEHHQVRLELPIGVHRPLGDLGQLLAGLALGVHVEVAELVIPLEVLLQAGAIALIPQIGGMIAADHQDLGGPERERQQKY
ncbi:hypothetical protein D3C79_774330 [compost metagenome]